ncbi:hypothetical protein [Streptomyces sp. NPDC051561]|uniref:hypothetical protein n=1 Tax=Streptomyces sp. NPDC051561 TaxID=3365658 RepID=UPI0037A3D4FA
MSYTLLYDPRGKLTSSIPLDRGRYCALARAVRARPSRPEVSRGDWAQHACTLTDHAALVMREIEKILPALRADDVRRPTAQQLLATGRTIVANDWESSVESACERAGLVLDLYEGLDALGGTPS